MATGDAVAGVVMQYWTKALLNVGITNIKARLGRFCISKSEQSVLLEGRGTIFRQSLTLPCRQKQWTLKLVPEGSPMRTDL